MPPPRKKNFFKNICCFWGHSNQKQTTPSLPLTKALLSTFFAKSGAARAAAQLIYRARLCSCLLPTAWWISGFRWFHYCIVDRVCNDIHMSGHIHNTQIMQKHIGTKDWCHPVWVHLYRNYIEQHQRVHVAVGFVDIKLILLKIYYRHTYLTYKRNLRLRPQQCLSCPHDYVLHARYFWYPLYFSTHMYAFVYWQHGLWTLHGYHDRYSIQWHLHEYRQCFHCKNQLVVSTTEWSPWLQTAEETVVM